VPWRRKCDALHISRRDDSNADLRRTTQTHPAKAGMIGAMKANLHIDRRPIVPKPRTELRGPRRARHGRRIGIRTRCGYLLFTTFV
jgi:hypothetical protein